MLPLQVPGGPELLVVLLIFLLFVGFLGVVVVVIVSLVRRESDGAGDDERIAELERRVDELEASRDGDDEPDGRDR